MNPKHPPGDPMTLGNMRELTSAISTSAALAGARRNPKLKPWARARHAELDPACGVCGCVCATFCR
jgi:hypothetical protein